MLKVFSLEPHSIHILVSISPPITFFRCESKFLWLFSLRSSGVNKRPCPLLFSRVHVIFTNKSNTKIKKVSSVREIRDRGRSDETTIL